MVQPITLIDIPGSKHRDLAPLSAPNGDFHYEKTTLCGLRGLKHIQNIDTIQFLFLALIEIPAANVGTLPACPANAGFEGLKHTVTSDPIVEYNTRPNRNAPLSHYRGQAPLPWT